MKSYMKVLAAVFTSFALTASGFAYASEVPDEQVVPGSLAANWSDQYGVFFEESVDTLRMPTLLYGYHTVNNRQNAISFCDGLDDPACSESTGFKFYALFPPCLSELDIDCIESVYAISPGSPARTHGKYIRTMPAKVAQPYKGDRSKGLPDGGNAGIWNIPGVKNKGGTEDYAVIISRVGDISRNSSSNSLGEIRAAILPVKVITNPDYKANVAQISDYGKTGVYSVAINHPGRANFEPCAIVEDGACALRQGFPDGVQFGMSVRFSNPVTGWLHGRISSPQIDYQIKSYGTRIEMQGLSTKVPVVGGFVPLSAFTEQVKKNISYIPNQGSTTFPGASGENSMRELSGWASILGEKAIAFPSQWIFYNLPEWQMQDANQCIRQSKTLAGFVTTNSTTYAAGPPVFNKETQSLDYKVASAHYLKDGSVFQGEYNLYVDSKVARCIYKFSSAPISATISIVNETGEARVATTTVKESEGWIQLSAAGFSFSSPTLRVRLTQDSGPRAETSNSAQATENAISTRARKTTITCKKGKTSKKVTGFKPVCPAGFKKK